MPPASRLRRAALAFGNLSGWRRCGAAALLGALATLALPPVFAVPLLWISFPGLILLIDARRSARGAFYDGWWFGFGHFSAGVYWIAYALLVDPLRFGWMIPFAVFGLGAVLAVFSGIAAALARLLAPQGVERVLVLAIAWCFAEWLRGWIFTGFPWNLIGTVWMPVLPVLQIASVVGAFGLGLLTVAIAAMPALLARPGRSGVAAVLASLGLLAAVALWGAARIPAEAAPTVPGVKLRLVQASIPEGEKWLPANRPLELQDQIDLTRSPGYDQITDVIWPETAVPYLLDQDGGARAIVASAAPPGGLVITGVERTTPRNVEPFQVWNSLEAIDDRARIVATYDKVHLVPFGEYVPFHDILSFAKLTPGSVDFSSGPGLRTLDAPGLPPFSPLICYESIFPGHVVAAGDRPQWLLNITNDGWFGISAGPYQDYAAARLRSVEEGLPLVRDGNTGVTAVVDPYGRVIAELPLGAHAYLDSALPRALPSLTIFARLGNWSAGILMALTAGLVLLLRIRRPAAEIVMGRA